MPLPIEDVLAIHELVARYAHALDSGDAEAFVATFTPDGVFDNPPTHREGREQLLLMGGNRAGSVGATRHFMSNVIVEGDGQRATVKAYLMMTRGIGQEPGIAVYNDDLVKVDGKWLFKIRRVIADKRVRPEPKPKPPEA